MSDTNSRISNYLETPVLKIMTCGSVDDGKSTFLGRLLLDSGNVLNDQLRAIENSGPGADSTGKAPELAFLVDGLKAEIEQGITIDVSYRYFFTSNRKFIVADAPGHAQYTRNMAVAASNSDAAIVLVDATSGVKIQTKRHLSILSMLRVDRLIIAVNKMDLVGFNTKQFRKIKDETARTIQNVYDHPCSFEFVPISARHGDNVVGGSAKMPWYSGKSILELLEGLEVDDSKDSPFCLPVQYVARDSGKRFYTGTVISGSFSTGDEIVVLPSSKRTTVKGISVAGHDSTGAEEGDPVMVELADDIDVSRGDRLVKSEKDLAQGNALSCRLFWFGEKPATAGNICEMKFFSRRIRGTITQIKEKFDLDNLKRIPTGGLEQNEIGFGRIVLSAAHFCLPFNDSKDLGSFLVVDIGSGDTVGLGTIDSIENTGPTYPYATIVNKSMRASMKSQHPMLIWMTGLSGAGKSTIGNLLDQRMYESGYHTYLLDGDILRNGLNGDLGFDAAGRRENIRRAGEAAKLLVDAGLIVIASFISPFIKDRSLVRSLLAKGEFCEVYVSAPIEECIRRDPKGLYAKARRGEISEFTGISSPYEPPVNPEIAIDTSLCSPQEAVEQILNYLAED